jgi:hypothetical protein
VLGQGAVQGADDGVDGGEFDVGVAADAEVGAGGGGFDFDVAHGAGIGSGAERVLGIALDFERRDVRLAEGVDEGSDRAIAGTAHCDGLPLEDEVGFDCDLLTALDGPEFAQVHCAVAQDIGFQEKPVDFLGFEFGAFFIRYGIDDAAEFFLERLGKLVAEFRFEDVSDAAFAGLGIDADDRLVAAQTRGQG